MLFAFIAFGRGFGFANIKDENVANDLIEKLNGHEFNGNKLRVERSERKDSNSGGSRRGAEKEEGRAERAVL